MKTILITALAMTAVCVGAQDKPSKIRITTENEPGIPMIVSGRVIDQNKVPLAGVKMYIYHTDAAGLYQKPGQHGNRLHGTLWTDKDGKFEFRTIRPAPYPGSTSGEHFHIGLTGGGLPDSYANIMFREDRPDEKLVIGVGKMNGSSRNYSGFAWKPDPKIKGQRLEIELRMVR